MFLREIDQSNFEDCVSLKRESERYVGKADYVLAEAYIFREDSAAYGIYLEEDRMIGLVIIRDRPSGSAYSFTDLFIADPFQGKGYGTQAVKLIVEKFKAERQADMAEIQVHETNQAAIRSYERNGFETVARAEWNRDFLVMRLILT